MIPSIVYMPDKAAIIKEAQKYLSKGQIDKAIAEWEKLGNEASDATTYNTIGDLYFRKGDKRSAVESFHKAATYLREGGFSLKALALYRKIINVDPLDADSYTALGELSEEKGLITDAIKYYLAASDILSKDAQKERFLAVYEKILSLAPLNIPLRDKVAGLFLKEGLIAEAVREYLITAKLCRDREDSEQAKDYFMKALDAHPDNTEAFLGLSSLAERAGDIGQAIEYARKVLAINPGDLETLRRCALLLTQSGAHDEAISCLCALIEACPTDAEPRRLMGDTYLAAGNREKAWESYRTVVDSFINEQNIEGAIALAAGFRDLDPVEIGKLLMSLYLQNDDLEQAFRENISLADLFSERGLQDDALAYYRNALKIHPDDIRLKKMLAEQEIGTGIETPSSEQEKTTEELLVDADIFIKYGLPDEAKEILEGLKEREPENIDIHLKLKLLYREADDKEKAVSECLILSELYDRAGDNEKRDHVTREAAEINPSDTRLVERPARGVEEEASAAPPVASEKFGSSDLDDYSEDIAEADFYMRQGLSQDALRIYQKLLALFPENHDLRKKVSSLQGETTESFGVREESPVSSAEEESLLEEFALSETETVEAQERPASQFDSDVLDIFEEFKKGLENELEAEDYETHYNLGIAYKEMGLTDDAIKEFQTSRKAPEYYVPSMSMLGICYMEKGLFPLAIDAFKHALSGIETRDESFWGAQYDLGTAYEKNGNVREAFELFSDIYGRDSQFREVSEKLNQLRSILGKAEPAQPAKEKKSRVSYL
jgi:tetratricopeptide (TPR) repeat protein